MSFLDQKAKNIKLIVFDIDNILTDGNIIWSSDLTETKNFSVVDGFGIKLAQSVGLKIGTISARKSAVSQKRIEELKFDLVSIGERNKLESLKKFKVDLNIDFSEIAYMGDDLLDLAILRKCGFSGTVPEAVFEVKREVDYVTKNSAGKGAVREFIDIIIRSTEKINLARENVSKCKV
jgi:3-deoxy-D-manno-octulosonate 8-phosphate phosphatase (KDO 8-P phosphatase)